MFHDILGFYNSIIQTLSGGDPVAKGLVTLWLLSALGFLARKWPSKIWSLILHNTTVSISLIDQTPYRQNQSRCYMEHWLISNSKIPVRNMSYVPPNGIYDETLMEFGGGTHYVYCDGRLYMVYKRCENSKDGVIKELHITIISRSQYLLTDIVTRLNVRSDTRYYYQVSADYRGGWQEQGIIRPLQKMVMSKEVKDKIDKAVLFYRDNKQWYIDNNVPRKLTIILYGPPGTGKSSIIRYISDLLNSDLHSLSLDMQNTHFESLMRSGRKGIDRVVAIEDFEQHAKKRKKSKLEKAEEAHPLMMPDVSTSFDVLLNTMQGVFPLCDVVTIMSTNHLEDVDEALLRKGRCDLLLEVPALGLDEVKQYYEISYGLKFPKEIVAISPIKACDMAGLYTDNPFEPEKFIQELKEKYEVKSFVLAA